MIPSDVGPYFVVNILAISAGPPSHAYIASVVATSNLQLSRSH